jgi:hypothetical protein
VVQIRQLLGASILETPHAASAGFTDYSQVDFFIIEQIRRLFGDLSADADNETR